MKGLLDSVIEVQHKEPVTLEVEGTLFVPLLALSIQKGGSSGIPRFILEHIAIEQTQIPLY